MAMKEVLLEYANPNGFWGSRIGDGLMKVYDIVTKAKPKTVVELGRGDGLFLVALLAACEDNDASLTSIDVSSLPHTKRGHILASTVDTAIYTGNDLLMQWDTPIDVLFINILHEDPEGLASEISGIATLTKLRLAKWLPHVTGITVILGTDWHPSIKSEITQAGLSIQHYPIGSGISVLK